MDDGSAQIRVWDPLTLQEKRRITVHDHGQPVTNVNELEWVRGEIYANIWQKDVIARISPVDGRVLGWIDLAGILPAADRTGQEDVLNGIAYDVLGNRLFVTGKLWPKLFEIKVVPLHGKKPVNPVPQFRVPGAFRLGRRPSAGALETNFGASVFVAGRRKALCPTMRTDSPRTNRSCGTACPSTPSSTTEKLGDEPALLTWTG